MKLGFTSVIQVYTGNTAITLKSDATVAYFVHVMLLKFTKEFRCYIIDREHTFAGFLLLVTAARVNRWESGENGREDVGKVLPWSDKLPATDYRDGRIVLYWVLHQAMEIKLSLFKMVIKMVTKSK